LSELTNRRKIATRTLGRARRLQNWLQKTMSFSLPLFYGRGVFNYDFGVLPRR